MSVYVSRYGIIYTCINSSITELKILLIPNYECICAYQMQTGSLRRIYGRTDTHKYD